MKEDGSREIGGAETFFGLERDLASRFPLYYATCKLHSPDMFCFFVSVMYF